MTNEWNLHEKLAGRFHPDYPDDLQVVVHEGGPRLSICKPELVWVRIKGGKGDLYSAEVLNQPENLQEVRQGSLIDFIVPESGEYPLQVRAKYLAERSLWAIHPCTQCGLSELFDAPSDLIKVIFPDAADGSLEMFTSFCGVCGGVQVVQWRDSIEAESTSTATKKNWQFWK